LNLVSAKVERQSLSELADTPPPEEHQAGNCFYFDICGTEPDSPVTQGKPRSICPLLDVFLNLPHLLEAFGDRSCVLNQFLHFLPWI
jgi:hypothetical protein